MSGKALGEAKVIFFLLGIGILVFAFLHSWSAVIFLSILGLAVSLFFRDPHREVPKDAISIVSPADGTVDTVEELSHIEALQGPGKRISIFLSVFNVHINRVPYEGKIQSVTHKIGHFVDARRTDAALHNENQLWLIETPRGMIGVRQIAGLIARRIVGWCRANEEVKKGQRLGLIKFGSRTDLYLPPDTEILVRMGQKVKGASTIVARWENRDHL